MSWWNAKYKNNHGEYEITFASKSYEKTKAVERICQAVIDKKVKSREDVEAVVRCKNCKWLVNGYCDHVFVGMRIIKEDSFCSYGERKENV